MATRKDGTGTDTPMGVIGTLVDTAAKNGELGVAAAQTIGYRTAMLAGALHNPTKLANPEFVRMGTEKVEASAEALHAFTLGLVDLQEAWLGLCALPFRTASLGLAGCTWPQAPMAILDMQRTLMEEATAAALRFAQSAAGLAGAALHPIHRTASANARRLERRHRLF